MERGGGRFCITSCIIRYSLYLPLLGHSNGCEIFVDIIKGEKLSSIKLAKMKHVCWSVRSSNRRGKDGLKGDKEGNRRFKFHIIREHENLVQDPFRFVL